MSVTSPSAVSPSPPASPARSVLVIFNPTAGRRRRRRLDRALARLAELGVRVEVRDTTAAGDARAFAAVARGCDLVAVAGGDGTINEAANGLVARDGDGGAVPALAIIPLGTANVLAAELGYRDMAPEAAAETLARGAVRLAHVGVANGRVFCQMVGVGFDAHVVAGVDVAFKRRVGKLAYVVETLRQLWRYKPRRYAVEIDGVRHVAASAVIANGHFYAGRYTCAPGASIDASTLDVCLFGRAGRWHVIRYAVGLFTGRLHRFADIEIVAGRQVRISALDPDGGSEPVQGDGDIITYLPVDIAVAPGRLAIVRPETA
jgi:diacylglycerol kinase (ATP)